MLFIFKLLTENVIRNDEMPVAFKIYWSLHNIAMVTSFVITIIYWTVLHKGKTSDTSMLIRYGISSLISLSFSVCSNNAVDSLKYSIACNEFRHYASWSVNCCVSVAAVPCYSADHIWSIVWPFLVHLLFVRWQKYVSISSSSSFTGSKCLSDKNSLSPLTAWAYLTFTMCWIGHSRKKHWSQRWARSYWHWPCTYSYFRCTNYVCSFSDDSAPLT